MPYVECSVSIGSIEVCGSAVAVVVVVVMVVVVVVVVWVLLVLLVLLVLSVLSVLLVLFVSNTPGISRHRLATITAASATAEQARTQPHSTLRSFRCACCAGCRPLCKRLSTYCLFCATLEEQGEAARFDTFRDEKQAQAWQTANVGASSPRTR